MAPGMGTIGVLVGISPFTLHHYKSISERIFDLHASYRSVQLAQIKSRCALCHISGDDA
jgi:hypothetical protein